MEVNKEFKYESLKKTKFKLDELLMKVDVECFGYVNLLQDIKFMKSVVKIPKDF